MLHRHVLLLHQRSHNWIGAKSPTFDRRMVYGMDHRAGAPLLDERLVDRVQILARIPIQLWIVWSARQARSRFNLNRSGTCYRLDASRFGWQRLFIEADNEQGCDGNRAPCPLRTCPDNNEEVLMTGFFWTFASMCGLMFSLPDWNHSRTWGYKPFIAMSLVTLLFAVLWLTEQL